MDECDTVSFAYQFNQNAFGAGNAQKTGLFRHFSECWHGFIDFILNRLQRLSIRLLDECKARGDIPFIRVARRKVMFLREDLDSFMSSRRKGGDDLDRQKAT